MYYIQRTIGIVALLALTSATWWAVRLAIADAAFRRQTPLDVSGSVKLAPENATYLYTAALQAEYAGQDPLPMLERVAAMNPRSSAPRIRLGLAAETRGDTAAAERWLREASDVDRQFETRWTLANFYFRQRRRNEFWTWIRSALEMSYGDRRPAFNLCWRMSDDATEVLAQAIPERREVIAAYLAYVLEQHRFNAIARVAALLAANRSPDDLPLLYEACDALLSSGLRSEAENLWQALGHPPPSGVTNSEFATPPIGHGFDWRIREQIGVHQSELDSPHAHRIRFEGRQPESAELLSQVVGGIHAGVAYTLQWQARTQGIPAATGAEWRIAGSTAPIAASDNWTRGEVVFTADSEYTALALFYRRPQGETRTEGILDLRSVAITPLP